MGRNIGYAITGGRNNRSGGAGGGRRGCGIVGIFAVIIIVFIIIAMVFALLSTSGGPRSTFERTALTNIAPGDVLTYFDYTGDNWFTDARRMESGAREAYRLTGVKFGIYVTKDISGETKPSDNILGAFTDALYDELFGDSNGHFLLVMVDLGDGHYAAWHAMGGLVQTVFDNEAVDIFYDRLDNYWYAGSDRYTESEMFGLTLQRTAERIMKITPTFWQAMAPWLFGLAAIIVIFVGVTVVLMASAKRKEAAAEQAKADAELLATPIAGLDGPPAPDPLLEKYSQEPPQ